MNIEEMTLLERFLLIWPGLLIVLAEVVGTVGIGAALTMLVLKIARKK